MDAYTGERLAKDKCLYLLLQGKLQPYLLGPYLLGPYLLRPHLCDEYLIIFRKSQDVAKYKCQMTHFCGGAR